MTSRRLSGEPLDSAYTAVVPSKPLRRCSSLRGIPFVFPTAHTARRKGVRCRRARLCLRRQTLQARNESIHLKEAKSQTGPIRSGGDSSDLRVAGMHFNPGPDAQDRLRRLFTILVSLAESDEASPADPSPDDDPVKEDWSAPPRTPAVIDDGATSSPAHDCASERLGLPPVGED